MTSAFAAGHWAVDPDEGSPETQEDRAHDLVPAHLQPEAVYATREVFRAYATAIAALPPRCREAFCLHVFGELSNGEIARRMNISVSMVEKHLIRGKAACRACRVNLES
jgi:RNA polymerase sigma-70 factor (ECF subfamily)